MTDYVRVDASPLDWAGDNPVIDIRDSPTSTPSSLATFFRITSSQAGRGHVAVILLDTHQIEQEDLTNAVFTDNPALARYLLEEFVPGFRGFRDLRGLERLAIVESKGFRAGGDGKHDYSETATTTGGEQIELRWEGLGQPFWVDFLADMNAGRSHDIHSLFVPAERASLRVGAARREGVSYPRDVAGHQSTMSFLAFGEAWVRKV